MHKKESRGNSVVHLQYISHISYQLAHSTGFQGEQWKNLSREEGQGMRHGLAKGSFSLCTQSATWCASRMPRSKTTLLFIYLLCCCGGEMLNKPACPWRATLKRGGPACTNYSPTTLISQRLCFGVGRWEATVHALALLKAICSIWPKTWWFIRRDTLIPLIAQQRDNFMVLKEFYWAAALDALTVLWGENARVAKTSRWWSGPHLNICSSQQWEQI